MKIFAHQATAYRELLSRAQTFFAGNWRNLPIRSRWHTLIVGPTGSGKTTLAFALEEQTGAALLRVNVTSYIPSGANNRAVAETIEVIVGHINAHPKSILFLDETDKIYHETPWMGYIRGELFEILDGRLPCGTKTPAFGEEEGCTQFPDEKSLSEKLRTSVFVMAAGTFQSFYETKNARTIGFNPETLDLSDGPTTEYIVKSLPRELTNRFNSRLLVLPELTKSHYQVIASEAEKSLPQWLAPAFRQAAARRMEQAIAAKSGCRFIEEALVTALEESQPPPQVDEDPFAFLEGTELECGF